MSHNPEYEKMPQNLNAFHLSEKALADLGKVKWAVTEKVHGANFSFVYENRKLLFAKRKEYLKWSDDFFGFQLVVKELEEKVIQLFEQLRSDIKAERYIIYGELFGGKYPHPKIEADEQVQAIQTGVYYHPSVKFCAFDIAIESGNTKWYLDYKTAVSYFERFNIFHARVLFSGKLNEALSYNIRINSTVPKQLGLPELNPNIIEGIVIKPLSHSELKGLEVRPVVKVKNPEFAEEKFHEAEKWSFVPDVKSHSEEFTFLVEEMTNYITYNRLESVLSKTGAIDFTNEKRMTEIKTEFLQDIFYDFNDNNNQILDSLTPSQKEWVKNRLNVCINEFITDNSKTN